MNLKHKLLSQIGLTFLAFNAYTQKPNILYILADDLGYNEISANGQKQFETPNIDRLAKQGISFTRHYSGSPVSAPSRCVLLTGLHTGHSYIRENKEIGEWNDFIGQLPLPDTTFTIAKMLKSKEYKTACIGKWGLGFYNTSGAPLNQGFTAAAEIAIAQGAEPRNASLVAWIIVFFGNFLVSFIYSFILLCKNKSTTTFKQPGAY